MSNSTYLSTERLDLREFNPDDLDFFADLMANPEVMRFSIKGLPWEREEAADYLHKRIITHYADYGYGLLAIVERQSGCLVGFAGLLSQLIDDQKEVELGYRFHPNFWGKGYATEACMALAQYAFEKLQFDYIISIIDPANSRSLKVAQRIGMSFWKKTLFHNIPVHVYVLKKLVVEPYQEKWIHTFEEEKKRLAITFEGFPIAFRHIGSTSIPGCAAKPIIDIMGITTDTTAVDSYNAKLEALGYEVLGELGLPQRRFFRRKLPTAVHLHIFEKTDPDVGRHLRFVEHLRAYPEKRRAYSALKEKMATDFSHDSMQYALSKEAFVRAVDREAAIVSSLPYAPYKNLWSQEEIHKAMEVNFHLQMTYFAKYLPTMQLHFERDVTVVRTPIADDTFNYVLAAKFTENSARKRIRQIISFYGDLPFYWWVSSCDTPTNLGKHLLEEGLRKRTENVGMYLDITRFTAHAESPLLFQRALSREHIHDFTVVFDESPHAWELVYSKLPPLLYQEGSSYEIYVAYLEDKPVTTGILLFHANVAGIYYLATTPSLQHHGFATAMMEHLLKRAQSKGYSLAVLQASPEGKALYEHLGFIPCSTFDEYSS